MWPLIMKLKKNKK